MSSSLREILVVPEPMVVSFKKRAHHTHGCDAPNWVEIKKLSGDNFDGLSSYSWLASLRGVGRNAVLVTPATADLDDQLSNEQPELRRGEEPPSEKMATVNCRDF